MKSFGGEEIGKNRLKGLYPAEGVDFLDAQPMGEESETADRGKSEHSPQSFIVRSDDDGYFPDVFRLPFRAL